MKNNCISKTKKGAEKSNIAYVLANVSNVWLKKKNLGVFHQFVFLRIVCEGQGLALP